MSNNQNSSDEYLRRKCEKEQETVALMIKLYCYKNHHSHEKGKLCDSCQALLTYAQDRSAHCPFMKNKTFCSNCKVHCYKPEMRQKIKSVMRFSGPRIMFYHPVMATHHVISTLIEKRRLNDKNKTH